jgi:ATP-dependent Clp protease protease subunit
MARAISKEWVEAYFDYGVDVVNRRIFFDQDVDATTIGYVIKGIYLMDSKSSDKHAMFQLYDVLQTITCDVETVAMGKAMSAAPLLVTAGTPGKRYATPHCFFMIHDGWLDGMDGKSRKEARATLDHYDDMAESWCALMAKHSKKDAAFWRRLCNKKEDIFFNAATALEYGLVDQLWDEREGE